MKLSQIAVATTLLGALPAVAAETGRAASIAPLPPDCWAEHTQTQPSPPRQGKDGVPAAAERQRPLTDPHPGAEHPTPAQLRPCTPPRGPAGQKIRAADPPGRMPLSARP